MSNAFLLQSLDSIASLPARTLTRRRRRTTRSMRLNRAERRWCHRSSELLALAQRATVAVMDREAAAAAARARGQHVRHRANGGQTEASQRARHRPRVGSTPPAPPARSVGAKARAARVHRSLNRRIWPRRCPSFARPMRVQCPNSMYPAVAAVAESVANRRTLYEFPPPGRGGDHSNRQARRRARRTFPRSEL